MVPKGYSIRTRTRNCITHRHLHTHTRATGSCQHRRRCVRPRTSPASLDLKGSGFQRSLQASSFARKAALDRSMRCRCKGNATRAWTSSPLPALPFRPSDSGWCRPAPIPTPSPLPDRSDVDKSVDARALVPCFAPAWVTNHGRSDSHPSTLLLQQPGEPTESIPPARCAARLAKPCSPRSPPPETAARFLQAPPLRCASH